MTSTVSAGVLATKTRPPLTAMGAACELMNVGWPTSRQPITNPDSIAAAMPTDRQRPTSPHKPPQRRPRRVAIESGVPSSTVNELLVRAATQPIRILAAKATEEPDFSSQRLRCKILRNDVADGALALIFAVAALSFDDARPRGTSDLD